jgi:multicomponent Na+:H+ antiporter subunit B
MKKQTKKEKKENQTFKEFDLIILKTATNYLIPLLLMASIFVMLRGHNLSGGGFVGGLIASIAFVLHSFAHSTKKTLSLFKTSPKFLIPIGLSISFLSAFLPVLKGKPFFTSLWSSKPVAVIGSVGTASFFDLGVYLVVLGVTLTILLSIKENV